MTARLVTALCVSLLGIILVVALNGTKPAWVDGALAAVVAAAVLVLFSPLPGKVARRIADDAQTREFEEYIEKEK